MTAMFGGIVGQKVVQARSGKFHILFQFFYLYSLESLPIQTLGLQDMVPKFLYLEKRCRKSCKIGNYFLWGWCSGMLMGASCGSQGKLTIMDDDVIEKSNLNRQILLRGWNIGQAKSKVAASAATAIDLCLQAKSIAKLCVLTSRSHCC